MSANETHTPTPWAKEPFVDNRKNGGDHHTYRITPQRGVYGSLFEDDADLIVAAVNSHASLTARVAELESLFTAARKTSAAISGRVAELEAALEDYVEADSATDNPNLSIRQYDRQMEKARKNAIAILARERSND